MSNQLYFRPTDGMRKEIMVSTDFLFDPTLLNIRSIRFRYNTFHTLNSVCQLKIYIWDKEKEWMKFLSDIR